MVSQVLGSFISLLSFVIVAGYPSNHHYLQGIQGPVSVQRTKDCPNGSTLSGKSCVSVKISPPNFVCPPSTILSNGQCISLAKAIQTCPDRFVQSGNHCSNTKAIPAMQICDKGELSGSVCRISIDVSPECPNGFKRLEEKCLRYSPQIIDCPVGYKLQGKNKCIKSICFSPDLVCPPDFSLGNDRICRKSISVPPRCDFGFTLVGNACHKEVSRVFDSCPDGFNTSGKSCIREWKSLALLECPSGFVLDQQNQCIKEIPIPPTCPDGTRRGTSSGQQQQCERFVAKQPVCNIGEELLDNNRCKQSRVSLLEVKCPNGYTLADRDCKKVHVEEPSFFCSRGSLENGKCVTRSAIPARIACPSGYQVNKGFQCVRDIPYDESNEIDTAANSKKSKISNCFNGKCTRTDVAPVEFVCPNETTRQGKECVAVLFYPPDVFCKAGTIDRENEKCVVVDVRPTITECLGGNIQPDGRCIQIEEILPTTFDCPDGSQLVNDNCVVIVPEIHYPSRIVREKPRGFCEVGVKRRNSCIQIDEISRSQVCPFGSEASSSGDYCVVKQLAFQSPPVIANRLPEYVCPKGSVPTGNVCCAAEETPPKYFCPNNEVLEDSRCLYTASLIYSPERVSLVAPRFACPSGYQQQGHECLMTTTEPARLECPSGYIKRFEGGNQECVRFHDRVPVCPIGTEMIAGGCSEKTYSPPRVTEIKVCTKGQAGC